MRSVRKLRQMVTRYVYSDAAERKAMRRTRLRLLKGWLSSERWKQLIREISWNVFSSRRRELLLVELGETYVVRSGDFSIGRLLYTKGEFEFEKFTVAVNLLKVVRVRTLIDVGANVGSICIPAVKRNLVDHCIAVEPEPTNFRLLTANVWLNGLQDRIDCRQLAAGAEDDAVLSLNLSDVNFGDHRIGDRNDFGESSAEFVSVSSCRLDTLLPPLDSHHDLLWSDAQGYDVEVLKGASQLILAGVPIVFEFDPQSCAVHSHVDDLLRLISNYSFVWDLGGREPKQLELTQVRQMWDDCLREGSGRFTDLLICN